MASTIQKRAVAPPIPVLSSRELQSQAADMRRRGKAYLDISIALGVSEMRARSLVQRYAARTKCLTTAFIETERCIQIEQLDAIYEAFVPDATRSGSTITLVDGDEVECRVGPDPKAAEVCLKVMDRKAKLLGLDAEREKGTAGGVHVTVSYTAMGAAKEVQTAEGTVVTAKAIPSPNYLPAGFTDVEEDDEEPSSGSECRSASTTSRTDQDNQAG